MGEIEGDQDQTPPPTMTTAAGGTHPTGMHSCLILSIPMEFDGLGGRVHGIITQNYTKTSSGSLFVGLNRDLLFYSQISSIFKTDFHLNGAQNH